MGESVFDIRDLLRRHRVKALSSSYTLYGDLSRRVIRILHIDQICAGDYRLNGKVFRGAPTQERSINPFFWNGLRSVVFRLPKTPLKTQAVVEGFWLSRVSRN